MIYLYQLQNVRWDINVIDFFIISDTTIAELIKEVADSNNFLESLQIEQEFMNGIDTDKVHPYIENSISQKEPLIKVSLRILMI